MEYNGECRTIICIGNEVASLSWLVHNNHMSCFSLILDLGECKKKSIILNAIIFEHSFPFNLFNGLVTI